MNLLDEILRIVSVFGPIIIGGVVYFTLRHQIDKLKAESLAARKKADLDEANTAKIYNDLAKDAGVELKSANTEVKSGEIRIQTLEKIVLDLNQRLLLQDQRLLQQENDKTRLEKEVKERDIRIDYLQSRITTLEGILDANHIVFPDNGGIKQE